MGADRFSDGHSGYVSGELRSEETDVSTDDAGGTTTDDVGGADDMLSPMEATDSDEVHNADGDEVVDPPDDWSGALSLIHISEPTRRLRGSRMPSSA